MSSFNEQVVGMFGGPEGIQRMRDQTDQLVRLQAASVRQQVALHAAITVACWAAVAVLTVVTAALVFLIGYGAYRGWLAGW